MKFTQLVQELEATYPEQPRVFHVLAARFYLGAETVETLRAQATTRPCHTRALHRPELTVEQVETIIRNR